MFKKKNKVVTISTAEKTELAKQKINEAYILFQEAHDSLNQANEKLKEISDESSKKLMILSSQIEDETIARQNVLDHISANNKLKEQLKPFIKGDN